MVQAPHGPRKGESIGASTGLRCMSIQSMADPQTGRIGARRFSHLLPRAASPGAVIQGSSSNQGNRVTLGGSVE
jgi:hypothetical protein